MHACVEMQAHKWQGAVVHTYEGTDAEVSHVAVTCTIGWTDMSLSLGVDQLATGYAQESADGLCQRMGNFTALARQMQAELGTVEMSNLCL